MVIFHLFAHKTLCGRICTKYGIGLEVADAIACDKIFGNRLRDSNKWAVKND